MDLIRVLTKLDHLKDILKELFTCNKEKELENNKD